MFHNLAGRIVTFTSVEFSGMIVAQNDQYLGLKLCYIPENFEFLAFFIHAACNSSSRRLLWTELSNSLDVNFPSIILGDFNTIIANHEKQGGSPFIASEAEELSDFIQNSALIDLGFSGSPFTWCNNRRGSARIYKRLDRGLANLKWIDSDISTSITLCPPTSPQVQACDLGYASMGLG